jgi:hypothetical protein
MLIWLENKMPILKASGVDGFLSTVNHFVTSTGQDMGVSCGRNGLWKSS